MKSYRVKARRPERAHEPTRHWMEIGIATGLEDGAILVTLNGLPFEFDGELRLDPVEEKKSRRPFERLDPVEEKKSDADA